MHGAIKWLESVDGELWLHQVKALGAEDVLVIDTLLKPFMEVAKHNHEFANFFLLLVQKWEEKYQIDANGITMMGLLTDIREELSKILATFKTSLNSDECGCGVPV